MGELQRVGYGGQPVAEAFRVVRPPRAVLVDLSTLFAREPHRTAVAAVFVWLGAGATTRRACR